MDASKVKEPNEFIDEKITQSTTVRPEPTEWPTDFSKVARLGKWTRRRHRFGYPVGPDKSVNLGPRPKEGSLWPQPQEFVLQANIF